MLARNGILKHSAQLSAADFYRNISSESLSTLYITLKVYSVSLFLLDDGPYGKTKDISGPEHPMASRRHSIPGMYYVLCRKKNMFYMCMY